MAKLTLKEKVREGFMAAMALKNYAARLKQDARDFGWCEAAKMASEMENEAKEFINKLK